MLSLPILPSSASQRVGPAVPGSSVRAAPRAVRLSITDRCDLACIYCRPHRHDGYLDSERRLDVDGWARLVEGLVRKGVTRLRVTGGEPLLHPDVVAIVAAVARIPGVEDVALTTNATRLAELAAPLRAAGLQRLNVSIDSLDADRFARLTRGGRLDRVLDGLDAAVRAGFTELKTNTVVVAASGDEPGNDDELPALVRWAWSLGMTPRFLELMTIGEGAKLVSRVVPYATMRARLAGLLAADPTVRPADRGPARYARSADGSARRVGFITGTSDTFCDGCDRLRATADGALRPCLATNDQVDVAAAIHAGDLEAIGDGLDRAWAQKPDGTSWKGCTEASAAGVNMRATGG